MKRLTLVALLALAACSPPADITLPDGVACDDEAMAAIRNGELDPRADPTSDQYDEAYALGYYGGVGCDVSGLLD